MSLGFLRKFTVNDRLILKILIYKKIDDSIFKDVLFGVIGMIIFTVLVCIVAYIARSRLMRKELSKGPNKILLLPEDLDFVGTTSSTFLSRVNHKIKITYLKP